MWSATFEAANVRHEHEWRLWQNSKIPEQKILMPGVEINLPPGRSRTVRVSAARPCRQVQLGDDLVRPAAGRWKIAGCSANEEPAARLKYRPSFEISESKDGGYLVLVSWPKGPEQQLDGFASVEAARSWIEEDGPNWIAGSPYSH